MSLILQAKHLTTRLAMGSQSYVVVDNLSFDLLSGKTLALVGESGCGKTMTALSIMRILSSPPALPSEGEVLYKGRNLLEIAEKEMRKIRGADIAMIFQDPMSALNPVYTIGDQLIEVAEIHMQLHGKAAYEKAVSALEDVRIPSPRDRMFDYPHQLSGGMKQRVMIAMALMCEPDVLIADEPTTALDVTIQKQILDLMRDLQKRKGMALLLITHDMGIVAEMADNVVVMYATQAIEKGSVYDIYDRMAHPYTQGLFNSLPTSEKKKERLSVISGSVPPISDLPPGCYFQPRCPHAMDICKQGKVPDLALSDSGHMAKCWLYKESEDR